MKIGFFERIWSYRLVGAGIGIALCGLGMAGKFPPFAGVALALISGILGIVGAFEAEEGSVKWKRMADFLLWMLLAAIAVFFVCIFYISSPLLKR
jgi:uncharacterized membrane protein HdeD (DUF308 family)